MSNIKISIITVTLNSEKTLRDTLNSIREQNYDNLEYIIIDGASSDSTLKIIKEYQDIITIMVSEKDDGISDAMNKGIALATGDLIGIIHSDDMLTPNSLMSLNCQWDGNTDVYYGDAIVCSEEGEKLHILKGSDNLQELRYGFCVSHPATFITRRAYNEYGVYDKKYKCCMDYDCILRMYKAGAKFKHIHENLVIFRMGGLSQRLRRNTINESCEVCIKHGGNKCRAHLLKYKKIFSDFFRPVLKKMGIHSRRVKKI